MKTFDYDGIVKAKESKYNEHKWVAIVSRQVRNQLTGSLIRHNYGIAQWVKEKEVSAKRIPLKMAEEIFNSYE